MKNRKGKAKVLYVLSIIVVIIGTLIFGISAEFADKEDKEDKTISSSSIPWILIMICWIVSFELYFIGWCVKDEDDTVWYWMKLGIMYIGIAIIMIGGLIVMLLIMLVKLISLIAVIVIAIIIVVFGMNYLVHKWCKHG